MRAFFAVELTDPLKRELIAYQEKLRRVFAAELRFIPEDNLHLTLRFLGEVPEEEINEIVSTAEKSLSGVAAFSLSLNCAGCFPDLRRARILWAGVDDPERGCMALVKSLSFLDSRYPPDEREYQPHITVARTKQAIEPKKLKACLEDTYFKGPLYNVSKVCLYRSLPAKNGVEYRKISEFQLKI